MQKKLTILAVGVSLATSMQAAPDVVQTSSKIGFVEGTRIYTEAKDSKRIEATFQEKQEQVNAEMQKLHTEYMQQRSDFERASREGLVKETELAKKKLELEAKERSISERAQQLQSEMQLFQYELQRDQMAPFEEKLAREAAEIGKKNNLDAVIVKETGRVLWVAPHVNFSDQMIKSLDKDSKAEVKPVKKAEVAAKPAAKK